VTGRFGVALSVEPFGAAGADGFVPGARRPPGRRAPTGPELPDDFHGLDFEALWRDRKETTVVERALVREALRSFPTARAMELGAGDGRLSPAVWSVANEFVAVDQRFEFLARLRDRVPRGVPSLLVEANLYHLPFVDGAATCGLLVRVYNFLVDPIPCLREIGRVLAPEGGLAVTCNVRPSVGSLVEDLRRSVTRPAGRPATSYTFSRAPVLAVVPSPFPTVSPRRAHFRSVLADAGFRSVGRFGCGLEDFRILDRIPSRAYIAAGRRLASAPIFPLEWELVRRAGPVPAGPLPPLLESLACPRCRRPLGPVDPRQDANQPCPTCGFLVRIEDGIVRARYVPN
jgi:SAM-dependent methyltransferase